MSQGDTGPAAQAVPAADTEQPLAFGGFQLGGLALALPMAALREVVPCGGLQPLACPAACVIGGIVLRGVLVPVVDLRLALGRPAAPPGAGSCVIVMVEGGCILGLLADAVSGVFSAAAGSVSRMRAQPASGDDAAAAILAGTVRADGGSGADGAPAMLLSPAALARLPQVPLVADPEPQRQHLRAASATATAFSGAPPAARPAASARPVMLARCGRVLLAIDAMGVHATLAHPQVQPSPLAMGHCRGVIAHGGAHPMVDLLALCGLGRSDLSGSFQAFLVRAGDGLVAFAVDAVIDVVRVADAAVVAVPRFALPHPTLFAGALPLAALPPEVAARAGAPAQQFLVLDAQALKAHADVAGLAATSRPVGGAPGGAVAAAALSTSIGAAADGRPLRNLVTYALAGETATPIEQVSEILPYDAEASAFGAAGALQGMVMNRGRSIPLLCLSQLQGLPPPRHGADASVLVVASAGEHLGFIVPQLRSIEPGQWPVVDDRGGAPAAGGPLDTRSLARLGSGAGQRLLPVLDLLALARSLQLPTESPVQANAA